MNSTRLTPIKSLFALMTVTSISVVLSACSPSVNEELSLALNVKEGDVFRMGYKYQKISTTAYLDEPSSELYIADWEFSFQVDSAENDEITIIATVDSILISNDSIGKFIEASDFQNLKGVSFSFKIGLDGELVGTSDLSPLKSHFIESLPLEERWLEELNGDSLTGGMTLDELKENPEYHEMFQTVISGFREVISLAVDQYLGKPTVSEMLQFFFIANNEEPLEGNSNWSNERLTFSDYIGSLQLDGNLAIENMEDNLATLTVTGRGVRNERTPIDQNMSTIFGGLGLTAEVSGWTAEVSGGLEVDLSSGLIERADFEITSNYQMHLDPSEELLSIMEFNNENERLAQLETLKSSPASAEVEIQIRRLD